MKQPLSGGRNRFDTGSSVSNQPLSQSPTNHQTDYLKVPLRLHLKLPVMMKGVYLIGSWPVKETILADVVTVVAGLCKVGTVEVRAFHQANLLHLNFTPLVIAESVVKPNVAACSWSRVGKPRHCQRKSFVLPL